jgi:hypothetical protein
MLQNIMTYASMIAMAFGVLLWAQATFVDAGDYAQQLYYETNEEVLYLEDKKKRLEDNFQKLEYEDERQLERKREERSLLKQKLKN